MSRRSGNCACLFRAARVAALSGAHPDIERLLEKRRGYSKGQIGIVWGPEDLKAFKEGWEKFSFNGL